MASGDDGVHSPNARNGTDFCGYNPSYPSTSQYVTAVGATFGPEFGQPERACQADLGGIITSGGGFSTLIPLPSWQDGAVKGYFKAVEKQPVAGFGRGRAIPDVSLLGHNYQVIIGGNEYYVSGYGRGFPTEFLTQL